VSAHALVVTGGELDKRVPAAEIETIRLGMNERPLHFILRDDDGCLLSEHGGKLRAL